MQIRDKAGHDPIADLGIPNNYVRWALESIEEVAGKNGLTIILREAGLEQLKDNFPPDDDEFGELTVGHYASLNAAVLNFFGRAARSMSIRTGRVLARRAIDRQAKVFNIAALLGLKLMPLNVKLKLGLGQMQDGFRKMWAAHGQEMVSRIEETDDAWLFIRETCPECAGKASDEPVCWLFVGSLHESTRWLTGKALDIAEVECRATGSPACVWRISKKPRD